MAETKTNSVVVSLGRVYNRLPALPQSIKEFIVVVVPWLALIFGVLGVLASLSAFGISTFFSPFVALGGGVGLATGLIFSSIIGLVESIMMLVAFPSLLKRRANGWTLLFWAEVLAVVAALVSVSASGVIVALIWFYFLYQIKPHYK